MIQPGQLVKVDIACGRRQARFGILRFPSSKYDRAFSVICGLKDAPYRACAAVNAIGLSASSKLTGVHDDPDATKDEANRSPDEQNLQLDETQEQFRVGKHVRPNPVVFVGNAERVAVRQPEVAGVNVPQKRGGQRADREEPG